MAPRRPNAEQADLVVLVLTKRQYMAHDLVADRYGRFRELPLALAACGADVHGLCLSYRPRPEGPFEDSDGTAHVHWTSLNLRRLVSFGATSYWRELHRIAGSIRPDIIWACSDVPHAVLGALLAHRLGAKLVIDLYDNFESYPLSRVPGINVALGRAVRSADAITCVSSPLSRLIRNDYRYQGKIEVIENAIPPGGFLPRDKAACRRQFGLPADGILIGTAGALSHGRGTDVLLEAFSKLAKRRSDVHLVLAGALDSSLDIPATDRVHYLGLLSANRVPELLSALDISVVCNRDSPFGRYCFPQKLYESIACEIPVAVARVGAMEDLLRDFPRNLYEPDSADSLVDTLSNLCTTPEVPALRVPTWTSLGARLNRFFIEIVQSPGRGVRTGAPRAGSS